MKEIEDEMRYDFTWLNNDDPDNYEVVITPCENGRFRMVDIVGKIKESYVIGVL